MFKAVQTFFLWRCLRFYKIPIHYSPVTSSFCLLHCF